MHPNILVFVTDQHRADWLSCMGNKQLRTPNIDSIAHHGVVFDRAYCNTPLCMPSRATMWTGLPASGHGVRTNGIDLDDKYETLPEILNNSGYKTISVGKLHLKSWHMSPKKTHNITDYDPVLFPECETVWNNRLVTKLPDHYFGLEKSHFLGGHGGYCFGEYLQWLEDNHPDAYAKLVNRESEKTSLRPWDNYYSTVPNELYYNEWIKSLTINEIDACEDDRPFFMWCSFPDPHFPFGPPKPYNQMFSPDQMPDPILWDDPRDDMNEFYHQEFYDKTGTLSVDGGPTSLEKNQIKETMSLAWGLVKSVDDSIGQIMDHLKNTGKLDNTIIVFMADHGELMGDHHLFCKGPFHYEGLIRVPFIISYPGIIKEGIRSDALVSILDFMPTMLDLAGVDYPDNRVKDWEGPFEGRLIYQNKSRLPGFSLGPILKGEQQSVQESILIEDDDDIRSVNLRTIVTKKYKLTVYSDKDFGELFNLADDPEEQTNLWHHQEYDTIKHELIRKLIDEMIRIQVRIKRRISIA